MKEIPGYDDDTPFVTLQRVYLYLRAVAVKSSRLDNDDLRSDIRVVHHDHGTARDEQSFCSRSIDMWFSRQPFEIFMDIWSIWGVDI